MRLFVPGPCCGMKHRTLIEEVVPSGGRATVRVLHVDAPSRRPRFAMEKLPEKGFVFWPVGCGDSTTVVVRDDVVLQIDIRHAESAEDDDDPKVPVIDELLNLLPKKDGKPYLAAFSATHLDKDHITGFKELKDKVTIGDLWFTPRVLWEQDEDELCEDAKAFRDEAE